MDDPQTPLQSPENITAKATPDVERAYAAEMKKLNGHIASLSKDIEALTEDLQRVAADFENYRKRVDRERDLVRSLAMRSAIEPFLPPLDNFGIALTHTHNHQEFVKGMHMISHQFTQVLLQLGVENIEPKNEMFNPEKHLAIDHVPSDLPPGTIVEVVAKGYAYNGIVIKPAKVKVAKACEETHVQHP